MATTIRRFVDKCYEVYEAQPAYKNGASSLTECDCIGMDKYSFRENGVKFSTTGTNWSFRNQVENIRPIQSEADLNVGDVVFKAYSQGESGWDLPAKYQPGGSGYNGDMNDYYHIGTVKSVNPLQIIHMTSPTAKMDTTLKNKGWDFAANWKKDYISDSPEPEPPTPPDPPEPPTPVEFATVHSDNGKPVKMRAKPSTGCKLYDELPVGTIVTVDQKDCTIDNDGNMWSQISYGTRKGWYMMSKFLIFEDQPTTVTYTVHIPYMTDYQADALIAQYPGSWKTVDGKSIG